MSLRMIFSAILLAVFLALMLLMLMGCGGRYAMSRPEMYLAPSLEKMPEKFWAVNYAIDPALDLSEGGHGVIAWPAVFLDKDGGETKLLALNLRSFGLDKQFFIMSPKDVIGGRLAVLDHGGKRTYNHRGEVRPLECGLSKGKIRIFQLLKDAISSCKIDVKKYADFLPELNQGLSFVKEISSDSEEFQAIKELYVKFRMKELEAARYYIAYKKSASNLTDEGLDQLAKEDALVRGVVDWLGRDWKIYATIPFIGFGSTALVAGGVKVFTLPSIWGDRLDRPGYMDHRLDAGETAEMILRAIEDYDRTRKRQETLELELNRKEEAE